jgi:glycosyltransferase involved in cell wall biosynthesis
MDRSIDELAVLCDFPEEGWPSMNLCAEMLMKNWPAEIGAQPVRVCPPFRRLFARRPSASSPRGERSTDRLFNRFWQYPRYVRKLTSKYPAFHLCDHSYSHLFHELPADRTGVFCHDLDTFRCLLDPAAERRPRWFRAMANRILTGFQRAAIVFFNSQQVRRQIEHYQLIEPGRLVHAPLGVAEEFFQTDLHDSQADVLLASLAGAPYLLHVGSCIPRKRVDVLIEVMAAVKRQHGNVKLVQVGGHWNESHLAAIRKANLESDILQKHDLPRTALAAIYRRASIVLMTSEAEGFGLPAIEALASGCRLVVSDIPVLREVAGEAAVFCPVGDVPAWTQAVCQLLSDPASGPAPQARLEQARHYSWKSHARIIAESYQELLAPAS